MLILNTWRCVMIRGILNYWWAICQSSGAVWGGIFREEIFSLLHWPPSRRGLTDTLSFSSSILCHAGLHLSEWMFNSACSYLTFVHAWACKQALSVYLFVLMTNSLSDSQNQRQQSRSVHRPPLPFSLFNITENPFLVLLMSPYVVLFKPAQTESVKLTQNVNNVPWNPNIRIGSSEWEGSVPVDANGKVINPRLWRVSETRLYWMHRSHWLNTQV